MEHGVDLTALDQIAAERGHRTAGRRVMAHGIVRRPAEV